MIGRHQGSVRANVRRVSKDTRESTPPGIAKRWPTLLMIKLGRITMHRFTEALEPFGIRPRHVAALIELRDRGELTQQSLCGQLHLDPTNLVAILNELEQRGYARRRRDPEDRRRHLVEISKKGIAAIDKLSVVMDGVECGDHRERGRTVVPRRRGARRQAPPQASPEASPSPRDCRHPAAQRRRP